VPRYRRDELELFHQAYLTGRQLADAGALEDAIACFDKVLGKLPRRDRRRAYRIADTRAPRGADLLALPAVFRDALLAKAYCLNELGRFDDAFAVLERALELDPENPRVYAELGFTHGAREDLEPARLAYRHALELEPENPEYLRALAHFAILEDDFSAARAYAQRALALDAAFVPCLQQLGFIAYREGKLKDAVRVLRQAHELASDDREVVLPLAGILRESGEPREALALLTAYLSAHPDDDEALGLMTEVLQHDAFGEEVIPHALRMLERDPDNVPALDLLGWGYYRQGQLKAALAIVNRLIALDPRQPHHRFKQAILLQAAGDFPGAMAAFMRVMHLDTPSELKAMADDAMASLDRAQLEHLLTRLRLDPVFREQLQQAPEAALHQAGYLLSPLGLQMLLALDLSEDGAGLPLPPNPTVH